MKENMRARLLAFADERFGTKPEYLWKRTPDAAVLRCDNQKWYAILMCVDGEKLGLSVQGSVDIVNVKCGPMIMGSLLAMNGIIPAYHMNKESWVSILLDGSVDEGQVTSLLEMSHEIVSQSGNKFRTQPKEWMIPASPAVYDVERDFGRDGTIIWKQSAGFIVGDTVFIYMAAPVSAVMYKCEIAEVGLQCSFSGGKPRKAVRLRLVHRFGTEDMPLEKMREMGISAVRGVRGVPYTLSYELGKLAAV